MKGGFNLAKLCANKWLRLAFLVLVIYFGYNYLFTRREGFKHQYAYDGAEKKENSGEEEGKSVGDLNADIDEIEEAQDVQEVEPAEEEESNNKENKESFRNLTAWA